MTNVTPSFFMPGVHRRRTTPKSPTTADMSNLVAALRDGSVDRRGGRHDVAGAATAHGGAMHPRSHPFITPAVVVLRRVIVVATGALIGVGPAAPIAHADALNPLYQLVDIAAQRLLTADPVAAFKWVNGGSIEDSARADQVLDAAAADARSRGLDETRVRRIFENQIHATEGVEYTRFGQWKFDPAHAPTSAPDLAQTREQIDGFNRAMVAEMAARRDVLFGPGCGEAVHGARDSVAAARSLDPLYRLALDAATASYCA